MALSGARIRIVLDANVLFSGCAFNEGGYPRQILDLVAKREVCLVINGYIISEVVDHLIEKNKRESVRWFSSFLSTALVDTVSTPSPDQVKANLYLVPRDPKDVPIVLTAINSNVDYLISGDGHINSHNESTHHIDKLVSVLTPKEFILLALS